MYTDTLTFECEVIGGVSTVWKGTAFMCPNTDNEIILLHSRFNNESSRECNNGSILVVSIEVADGNKYISLVNVTFNSLLIGKTVECFSDDGLISSLVTNYTITNKDKGINYNNGMKTQFSNT